MQMLSLSFASQLCLGRLGVHCGLFNLVPIQTRIIVLVQKNTLIFTLCGIGLCLRVKKKEAYTGNKIVRAGALEIPITSLAVDKP
jgi:hypothetical protein